MTPNRPTPLPSMFDLTGRVALVTGASGYLGSAIAEGLAEAGCRIIVASRDGARGKSAAERLPSVPTGPHLAVTMDQLDVGSLEQRFRDASTLAGHIDILVNNGHDALAEDWTSVTGEQFNRQLSNATGYFLLARALRDHAVERQAAGTVIMLGSMYGVVGSYPDAYDGICPASPVAYHALKGGIIHMTRHLAVYWARDRIRVNCLSPGPFPGPHVDPRLVERLQAKSPMRRMGTPEELKGAAVFLASDASSYVTGHNLIVDGGWTAW